MDIFINLGYFGLFLSSFLAATIVPLSSEVVLFALIGFKFNVYGCLVLASLGNWMGAMTNYALGYAGKWEWVEKYFKVKRQTIEKQQHRLEKFGPILAGLSWLPVVGELFPLSLGFFRVKPFWCAVFMLLGIVIRYLVIAYVSLQIF
jgi:membrane protein YqaA with SNARE-associated domain